MYIRDFRPADAQAIAALFFDSVRALGLRYYNQSQVEAWAPEIPGPAWFELRAEDGRIFLVAADEEHHPIAYADLEMNGHIDHLYCRPDYAGRGVASNLYDHLEQEGRVRGIVRLHVEASEVARGLFLRKGFVESERREFSLRGVTLHNYRMEKRLIRQDHDR
jgi:putative acetyltransferase